MCGIFGGIKNVKAQNLKMLGVLNESRGEDSTGMFDSDGYIKDNQSFRNFVLSDQSDYIKKFKNYLVGHTRFATTGEKTVRNAHPFEYGNIIGVHNGIIRNFKTLKNKYNLKKMECDSEILFYLLDKKGIEGLKEVVGYYTIVWSDSRTPNKLYFIQHECSLAYNRGKDYLYFCTDADDLEITLGNNTKTIYIAEDILYAIDINTLKIKKEKIKGLQSDTKYITISKSSKNWQDSWEKEEKDYYKNYSEHCPLEYTEKEYYKDKYSKKKKGKGIPILSIEDQNDYSMTCPHCNEMITIEEAHKEICPTCRGILSGLVYRCYHCEGIYLLEQILDNEKCPICHLHTILDEKYLIEPDYETV